MRSHPFPYLEVTVKHLLSALCPTAQLHERVKRGSTSDECHALGSGSARALTSDSKPVRL